MTSRSTGIGNTPEYQEFWSFKSPLISLTSRLLWSAGIFLCNEAWNQADGQWLKLQSTSQEMKNVPLQHGSMSSPAAKRVTCIGLHHHCCICNRHRRVYILTAAGTRGSCQCCPCWGAGHHQMPDHANSWWNQELAAKRGSVVPPPARQQCLCHLAAVVCTAPTSPLPHIFPVSGSGAAVGRKEEQYPLPSSPLLVDQI